MNPKINFLNIAKWIAIRGAVALVTIVTGLSTVFIATRLSPRNPIGEIIGRLTAMGASLRPEEVEVMRRTLLELFGLDKPLWMQYIFFLKNALTWNFGPSYIYFPVSVSSIIAGSIWWTVFLLVLVIIISWVLGITFGILSSYFEGKYISRIMNSIFVIIYPLPYAVFALVLFLVFGVLIGIYTGLGGAGFTKPSFSIEFIVAVLSRAWLPALSLIILWIAGWFLSTYLLVASIKREDYVIYAIVRGLPKKGILSRYLFRNIVLPQITGLALSIGNIFSGAVATEYIFSYPGLGYLIMLALMRADYNLLLGISAYSIVGVAFAAFILDLVYPFIDPRIKYGFKGE
ncbi:MAG: ABC transporter permease [Candidatus Bathyarchaeia archaeon]